MSPFRRVPVATFLTFLELRMRRSMCSMAFCSCSSASSTSSSSSRWFRFGDGRASSICADLGDKREIDTGKLATSSAEAFLQVKTKHENKKRREKGHILWIALIQRADETHTNKNNEPFSTESPVLVITPLGTILPKIEIIQIIISHFSCLPLLWTNKAKKEAVDTASGL